MDLRVIRSAEELEPLAQEWNELLRNSASHVPFLRYEYLSVWWRTLGGGEWPRGDLYVVTVRDGDGELYGIAPMFLTENRESQAALMLLGSVEISDYLDVIAPQANLDGFINVLLEHLDGPRAPAWKVLDWYNLLEDSPTLNALDSAADAHGWIYNSENIQHAPYVPLPGNWEAYLAGIDKKQRHEIRRKMRRIERHPEPVRWYFVKDEARLSAEIEDFLDLMSQDPAKEKFLTRAMKDQMRLALKAAYEAGWLQLAFLEVGGRKAAGYINFDYDNHIWLYNSGIDFSYGSLSPGWVLLGHLLKWANEQGRAAFDFMRGDESYKYRFGGVDRFVVRAQVTR
jgi:CelD/BcsL family acetyltransferase involved in cellulose biosynthesis